MGEGIDVVEEAVIVGDGAEGEGRLGGHAARYNIRWLYTVALGYGIPPPQGVQCCELGGH